MEFNRQVDNIHKLPHVVECKSTVDDYMLFYDMYGVSCNTKTQILFPANQWQAHKTIALNAVSVQCAWISYVSRMQNGTSHAHESQVQRYKCMGCIIEMGFYAKLAPRQTDRHTRVVQHLSTTWTSWRLFDPLGNDVVYIVWTQESFVNRIRMLFVCLNVDRCTGRPYEYHRVRQDISKGLFGIFINFHFVIFRKVFSVVVVGSRQNP